MSSRGPLKDRLVFWSTLKDSKQGSNTVMERKGGKPEDWLIDVLPNEHIETMTVWLLSVMYRYVIDGRVGDVTV